MAVIEPQFQRDFISLLPKELALYVLSFLTPRDLTRAAQTCRCWRVLAEDNLLWREKCREAGIDDVRDTLNKRRLRGSSHHPPLNCGLSSPSGSNQNTAPIITPSPWKVRSYSLSSPNRFVLQFMSSFNIRLHLFRRRICVTGILNWTGEWGRSLNQGF